MKWWAKAGVCVFTALASAGIARSQSLQLQASTPDEFDAYLTVLEARQPAQIVAAAREFARAWPKSELLAHTLQLEMEAHRTLGNLDGAIEAGEQAVKLVPNNIAVLVGLAGLLPLAGGDPQRLDRAEALATQALKLLRSFRISRYVPLEEWERVRARLQSNAHAALGIVAYRRNEIAQATREFEAAVALAPEPDPAQYYRLGRLYLAGKRLPEARDTLRRAAQLNDPAVRRMAEQALESLDR